MATIDVHAPDIEIINEKSIPQSLEFSKGSFQSIHNDDKLTSLFVFYLYCSFGVRRLGPDIVQNVPPFNYQLSSDAFVAYEACHLQQMN